MLFSFHYNIFAKVSFLLFLQHKLSLLPTIYTPCPGPVPSGPHYQPAV